ncbi:hypothetical protein PRIPAC_72623, partial [Pristionchus pacificus]|uniref:Uncharacterized protein n=1 Tax=Pristionchus pacificus TaxID=54126 RepID=A0A2A6BZU8_PRIPA
MKWIGGERKGTNSESVKFLVSIADIVNKLVIIVGGSHDAQSASILHSIFFIREILKRKCNEFEISLLPDVHGLLISQDEIIPTKLLHTSGKKVHFHTWPRAPSMDAQIGLYHVKSHDYPNRRRHIAIDRLT